MKDRYKLSKVEEEIKKTEERAKSAKAKGMHATYSHLMLDIAILKDQRQKLRTYPQHKGV